ncbi:hypothetical protein ACLOJK_000185 [Asimina triloba]
MALNPAIAPSRSPSSSSYFHLLAKPVSHSPVPCKISASLRPQPHSRPQFSCYFDIRPSSNSSYRTCSGDLGPSQMRFSEEGFDFFKLRAGPPGGSGGDGGYGGSSGGGRWDSDGRGEEEGGRNNHSLLSW